MSLNIINIKNENEALKKQINELKQENNKLKNDLLMVNQTLLNYQNNINKLNMNLFEKEKELNYLKQKLKNNGNMKQFVDYNNIIVVNFISGDGRINYGIKCLNTDTFAEVEEKLYKIYDEYRNTNNQFVSGGKIIIRFKKIYENNIKDGQKVQLIVPSE